MAFKFKITEDWYMIRASKSGWIYVNEKTKEMVQVRKLKNSNNYIVTKSGPKDTLLTMFEKTKEFDNHNKALMYASELMR